MEYISTLYGIYNNSTIDVSSRQLPGPSGGDHFGLLANSFLYFCTQLAVFIFLILLATKPNTKLRQGPCPVGRVIYSSYYLNSFFFNSSMILFYIF